jgi:glycosyltransferase involved in cell wall biosynthesis
MAGPRFSIVIPTRERADTLRFALQICLDQDFDDYEVVVCDNCSSPATKAVVDSFASPRIVYHRSPTPLCMRENWNLAYSLTRGQYVAYIGDDDGLMPHAFSQLDELIRRHGVKAVTWHCAFYCWPNVARSDLANYLHISMSRYQKWFEGPQTIRDVMAGRLSPSFLPNIYHGLIAREVLETIRSRTGHVFGSYMPDTYTSFAVAYVVDRYLLLTVPMSVSGFSGHSNNIAFHFLRSKHENVQRYRTENAAAGVDLHPWVPDLPMCWTGVADSFLVAKGDLFPDDSSLELDRKFLAEVVLEQPPIDDLAEWPAVLAAIRRSLSDDPKLVAWFDERAKLVGPKVCPRCTFRGPEGLHFGNLHLDASKYGLEEVASAGRLASRALGYGTKPIVWKSADSVPDGLLRRLLSRVRLEIALFLHRRWRPRSTPLSGV